MYDGRMKYDASGSNMTSVQRYSRPIPGAGELKRAPGPKIAD